MQNTDQREPTWQETLILLLYHLGIHYRQPALKLHKSIRAHRGRRRRVR